MRGRRLLRLPTSDASNDTQDGRIILAWQCLRTGFDESQIERTHFFVLEHAS